MKANGAIAVPWLADRGFAANGEPCFIYVVSTSGDAPIAIAAALAGIVLPDVSRAVQPQKLSYPVARFTLPQRSFSRPYCLTRLPPQPVAAAAPGPPRAPTGCFHCASSQGGRPPGTRLPVPEVDIAWRLSARVGACRSSGP